MKFNMEIFRSLVMKCYEEMEYPKDLFAFDDTVEVFRLYFAEYETHTEGTPHPNINTMQIKRIIKKMPYVHNHYVETLSPEDYEPLIKWHFQTEYDCCDYNINHFFSGYIRYYRNSELLKMIEEDEDYGDE